MKNHFNSMKELSQTLSFLSPDLISEMTEVSIEKIIPKKTEILREGQFVKVIPIVLEGLIKVFTRQDDKELLLYYIQENESCIMSFAAGLDREPSKIYAVTEEDTKAILLPVAEVAKWVKRFPEINNLFFQQYNKRYSDLIDTVNHVLFDKIDKRLYDYLLEKKKVTKQNPLKISHRQIASDLATAREVITRAIKKLEYEQKVKQHGHTIEIL